MGKINLQIRMADLRSCYDANDSLMNLNQCLMIDAVGV
jgi:hypothetical protein